MKNNKKLKLICLFGAILIGIIASFNLFTNDGFSFHDETQIVNLFEYNKVIGLGQFPPRWSPDTHFTYGSPYPEFNYQLPYYLGVVYHRLGFDLLDSYKLILASSFVLGSVGMYFLGSLIAGPLVGLATSFLFTFTPYRAVDVFVRGTIGEAMGIALFPWVFMSLFSLRNKNDFKNIFLVAISFSTLILTHQPSTAFGLPVILLIFIISEILSKNLKFFISLIKSLFLTVCLTSFYLFPLLLEQKYIKPVLPFNFYDHFPFIKQLIFSKWGYGVSIEGPYDGMSFQVGIANLFVIVFGAILVIFNWKKISKNIYLFGTLISIFVVFFLMNIRSSFIWDHFPYTNSIQFPWRLLAIMAFLTSFLYLLILNSTRGIVRNLLFFIIPLIALFNVYSYFHPGTIVSHQDSYYLERYLPNQVVKKGDKVSLLYLDYTENYLPLPVNSERPLNMPDAVYSTQNKNSSVNISFDNQFETHGTIVAQRDDILTINRFFYPGWIVSLDGDRKDIKLNNLGAMTFEVPIGTHQFQVKFIDTPVRKFGNYLSLIAVVLSIAFLVYNSSRPWKPYPLKK